jgi:PAS domain S-box-containing protein
MTDLADEARRSRAEEDARRSEEKYRRVVESTRDGIWQFDRHGKTELANRQMSEMLGLEAGSLIGRPLTDFVPTAALTETREALNRVGQIGSLTSDLRLRHHDGSDVWTLTTMAALTDERGDFAGLTCIVTDVTGRKRLEDQLLHSQKMDAIGRLAGGIAHEFNNLLTSIIGFTDLLTLRLSDDADAVSDLRKIRLASDRATNLIRRLLTFARKQSSRPETLDVRTIIESAHRILATVIGEDIELRIMTAATPCLARVDPAQLEQALLNLVINARDAMPTGGILEIAVDTAGLAGESGLAGTGNWVRLRVRDSGKGIAPENLDTIFEPFFTTKGVEGGSGLGLAVVYGIVKQNGGQVTVASEPGAGTTFTIYLPLVQTRTHSAPPPPLLAQPAGTETVLVVEDNDLVRNIIVRTLKALGYRILLAEDGEKALVVAEAFADPIHLVLTDVVMPRMSGYELVDKLRAVRPALRAVFVSGYSINALAGRGAPPAETFFLDKPFTGTALAQKVREVLG